VLICIKIDPLKKGSLQRARHRFILYQIMARQNQHSLLFV